MPFRNARHCCSSSNKYHPYAEIWECFSKTSGTEGGLGSQISRTPAQFIINVTVIYFEGLLGRMEK